MQEVAGTKKKYIVLIRKIVLEHDLSFVGLSKNSGESTTIKATSQCVLNQQISISTVEQKANDTNATLHIMRKVGGQDIQMGSVVFDCKNQKILKPLTKQFFSKQLGNKKGYIEYKFIGVDAKTMTAEQISKSVNIKNQLVFKVSQHAATKNQIDSLMALIHQKDQIIAKMELQIQKLIKQTKKLNKSLSKQKSTNQLQKNINLNIKLNTQSILNKNLKSRNNLWEKQKQQYQYQVQKLQRKIRDFQNREKHFRMQIEQLRRKNIDIQSKKKSDLRKQIQDKYQIQSAKENRDLGIQLKNNQQILWEQRQKKNKYIQQQLTEQLRKIEEQKSKQKLKGDLEMEIRFELQRQLQKQKQRGQQKDKQRDRDRDKQRIRDQERQKQRERSRSYLRQSQIEHKQILKQLNQLEEDKLKLQQKYDIQKTELNEITIKLERAQNQILKLEDENIQLRKTKSQLLKQVQGFTFKQQNQQDPTMNEKLPIIAYEQMILNQRRQIHDQKLRAEIEAVRTKAFKDQKQYKDKIQQKQMQIMRLKLSQKSANRQKQIYSQRIKQMMGSVEGDRKKFLQALQRSSKYDVQQARAKQLETQNTQLQTNYYKSVKQKNQLQNNVKKLKAKIQQRESEWVKLKSIQSQFEYYRAQSEKFEKAYRKFQKQYEDVRQYCQNLQTLVGRKPKKTVNEQINTEVQQKYKNTIRDKLQFLMQQVKDMEKKFYLEQIQIWLTQRTKVVEFYVRKFDQDKTRILEMEMNQQAKNNLITEKQKEIVELKEQAITDIDRKIAKLKLMVKQDDQKAVNAVIDKNFIQQTIKGLQQKLLKLRQEQQKLKKQNLALRQKNSKLQEDLKQKNKKIKTQEEQQTNKKSLSLLQQDNIKEGVKIEDMRKSYIDEFKKSRDFFMNKPFEELKKLNSELQAQKRKVETQMNTLKFNFDKERVQLNDKIRAKQRQLKKMQHDATTQQKVSTKHLNQIQNHKRARQEMEILIRKMRDELKQVSRTLQFKQRQCSQALTQIKKMQKNLQQYQLAEKRMFDDVKKLKERLQKKQTEMESIMQQRNQKSKQLDAQRVLQISKLQQKIKELQQKLQREISQNLGIKTENQRLSQNITEYDVKMREKQEQYLVLDDAFNIYKEQWGEKVTEYQSQNNILQNNIMQIADQMAVKENQCNELQIKIHFAQKRQQTLANMKEQLEQAHKVLKKQYQQLQNQMKIQYQKFKDQIKSLDLLKQKIETHAQQNLKLQTTIQQKDFQLKDKEKQVHHIQIQLVKAEGEIKNLQFKIEFMQQKIDDLTKRMELLSIEKEQLRIQKIQQVPLEKSRKSMDDKSRKSSEGLELSPQGPSIPRKNLNTSINRSTSLIQTGQPPKSLNTSNLLRKSSSKEKQQQNEQLRYSKQGIELNVLKPVQQSYDDMKGTMGIPRKEVQPNDSSKVDIDVYESDQQRNPTRKSSIDKLNFSPSKSNKNIGIKASQIGINQPSRMEKSYDEGSLQQNVVGQQIMKNEDQQILDQNLNEDVDNLKLQIVELEHIIQQLTQQKNGYFQEMKNWKKLYQNDINFEKSEFKSEEDNMKQDLNKEKLSEPDLFKKTTTLRKTPSQRSPTESNVQIIQRHSLKQNQNLKKQIQQLKSKIIQYELSVSQNQNHIKQLEQGLTIEQEGKEKLISELTQYVSKIESQAAKRRKLQEQLEQRQNQFSHKCTQYEGRIEQLLMEDMKKDETINQTMKIIYQLHQQIKSKDNICSSLQAEIQKYKLLIQKLNKTIQFNKMQYRKYEESAELQILRLKESTDDLKEELETKASQIIELAEKYVHLEDSLHLNKQQVLKREQQILVQRSKVKEAYDKKDQVLEQMRKFELSKSSLINRIGELQVKLGEKTQQLKQLTKQTAIAYKKYDIQIQATKQQLVLVRKKLKQRQQHITSIKMELANYNDVCHGLQKQRNSLASELAKVERQLRQIMKTYQGELDQLNKDKNALVKQLEKYSLVNKENQAKIQVLNKEISKKNREIKQIAFKSEQSQGTIEKMKEKHRKQIGDLIAEMEIKNDQYHKIKIQLQRESQHYFSKECQYLADKDKKQKMQSEYTLKLEQYEKIIKQMQDQFKQIQSRPSSDQYEQVCFQNELYKNRIEELQNLLRDQGEQHQEQIMLEFKKYKMNKERQIQDLQSQMQKYGSKLNNLQQNNYVLKKDNNNMKTQLRTLMQQKIKMQKLFQQNQEDLRELKQQVNFYKGQRVDQLNKLLNQSYD